MTSQPLAMRQRSLGALGSAVESRILAIQGGYLAGLSTARAQLAQLRRGVGKQAGEVPEIWDLTVGLVPSHLSWSRDEPSRGELAAHAAMTLYALHQQSQSTAAHVRGIFFGTAVARLRDLDTASEQAVTRRFMAVATADTIDEVLIHVRGILTQLRAKNIGLDYATFADDLLGLLDPSRRIEVRLRWGRQFYRVTRSENESADDQAAADNETKEVSS